VALTAALGALVIAAASAVVARRVRSSRARRTALVVLGVAGSVALYLLAAAAVLRQPTSVR